MSSEGRIKKLSCCNNYYQSTEYQSIIEISPHKQFVSMTFLMGLIESISFLTIRENISLSRNRRTYIRPGINFL